MDAQAPALPHCTLPSRAIPPNPTSAEAKTNTANPDSIGQKTAGKNQHPQHQQKEVMSILLIIAVPRKRSAGKKRIATRQHQGSESGRRFRARAPNDLPSTGFFNGAMS